MPFVVPLKPPSVKQVKGRPAGISTSLRPKLQNHTSFKHTIYGDSQIAFDWKGSLKVILPNPPAVSRDTSN